MKYVMVYWSRYGHNKQIIDYLSEKLSDKGHETSVFKTDDSDLGSLPDADVYIFSASAEAFRVQKNMRKFMKKLSGMQGKNFAIINTHGMKSKNWLKSMDKILSKEGMKKVAETDFVIGEGQEKGEGLQDGWKEKLKQFSERL
ncbi:MAG: flavodoxin domain-containing protein [Thermoplasmatota archaeon]